MLPIFVFRMRGRTVKSDYLSERGGVEKKSSQKNKKGQGTKRRFVPPAVRISFRRFGNLWAAERLAGDRQFPDAEFFVRTCLHLDFLDR